MLLQDKVVPRDIRPLYVLRMKGFLFALAMGHASLQHGGFRKV